MLTEPPADGALLQVAERTFQTFAPHLWPWTGWYALVVADQFVGVFPTLGDAIAAAQSTEPDGVLVRRIGGDSAVPIPPAEGGFGPAVTSWTH